MMDILYRKNKNWGCVALEVCCSTIAKDDIVQAIQQKVKQDEHSSENLTVDIVDMTFHCENKDNTKVWTCFVVYAIV